MSLPLCVDLDGTIVRSDLLFESVAVLLRTKPRLVILLPVWLLRGKAQLKREIARRVEVNAALLPYNQEFVEWVAGERARGRTTLLVTGSDQLLAEGVAEYLKIFDSVIGSDGSLNQKGETKLRTLSALYGQDFAYAGNSRADLVIWKGCGEAIVVNANASTEAAARAIGNVARLFPAQVASYARVRNAFSPKLWQVILTASIAPTVVTQNPLWAAAALAICCLLSGIFLARDIVRLEQDRTTPSRAESPLANGDLQLSLAMVMAPGLMLSGIAGACYIAARSAG